MQAPAQFGSLGPEVFWDFMKVLHEERVQNIAALVGLVAACQPILRLGANPARTERVHAALVEAEARRWAVIQLSKRLVGYDYGNALLRDKAFSQAYVKAKFVSKALACSSSNNLRDFYKKVLCVCSSSSGRILKLVVK